MNGGTVISRARRRAGLTQSALAERLGTTTSAVSRWEHGKVDPAFATVDRVARACGIELYEVLAEPDVDEHELGLLETSLALTVSERLQRLIDFTAFVDAGRR